MEDNVPMMEDDEVIAQDMPVDDVIYNLDEKELQGKRFRRWFLTYPRCGMDKNVVYFQLQNILIRKGVKIDLYIIARETHKDMVPNASIYHIHVVMRISKGIRWSKDVFDLVDTDGTKYHGSYGKVVFWEKSILYLIKEDKNYITNIDLKSVEKKSKLQKVIMTTQEKNKMILDNNLIDLIDSGMVPISQIRNLQKCKDIYYMMKRNKTPFVNRKCFWIYGQPGVGKSYTIRELFPDLYPKDCTKWWDQYKGEKVVLFEEFDPRCKDELSTLLKKWSDVYSLIGEVKGGSVDLVYDIFVVTSNYTINEIFKTSVDIDLNIAITRRFYQIEYPEPGSRNEVGKYSLEDYKRTSSEIKEEINRILSSP